MSTPIYLAVFMYPMLFSDSTVKFPSLTLYVSCEFVTESRSVAVTVIEMQFLGCLKFLNNI